MKPREIKALQALATMFVGDGCSPNLYFVIDQGIVVAITRRYDEALVAWRRLADRFPLVESALEDRKSGEIASVRPDEERGGKLVRWDPPNRGGR